MLEIETEQTDWDAARPARSTGWLTSILGTLGMIVMGFILIRAGSDRTSAASSSPATVCRVLLPGRECPVFSMAWSPDGRKLAASGFGPTIRIWDRENGRISSITGGTDPHRFIIGWSEDGLRLVVGGAEIPVEAWEMGAPATDEGREVTQPEDRPGSVRMIAGASRGSSIRVRGPVDRRSDWLPVSDRIANSAAFSPDGLMVATAEVDQAVRVREAGSGRLRHTFRGDFRGFSSVAFSPDGSKIAAGGGGSLRLWDSATGTPLATLGGSNCGSAVIDFSPDGLRLASASWDGTIRVWDLASGRESRKLGGHDGQVLSLAWSPDGKTLASGGYDSTVRLWELAEPAVQVARAD